MRTRLASALLLGIFVVANPTFGAGPNRTSYQGLLLDSVGAPLTGTVDLQLRIWRDAFSTDLTDQLYAEDHLNVAVSAGVFSIELGGGIAVSGSFSADTFSESNRWLETVVDGETLSPRTPFLSVPYAFQAENADSPGRISGEIAMFGLATCPPGWTELPAAQGRALVGRSVSGTGLGTVGNPLADLEDRTHAHAVDSSDTTSSSGSHAHFVGSRSTTTDSHNHAWSRYTGSPSFDWQSYRSNGTEFTLTDFGNGIDGSGSGVYPIAGSSSSGATIYTNNDSHSHTVSSTSTGSSGFHSHSVSVDSATGISRTSDVLPYLQVLVCMKD